MEKRIAEVDTSLPHLKNELMKKKCVNTMMIMIIINITEQNITHKGNKIRLIVSKITHKKSVKVKKELDLSHHTYYSTRNTKSKTIGFMRLLSLIYLLMRGCHHLLG